MNIFLIKWIERRYAMTNEEFNKILERRIEQIKSTLSDKAKMYAIGDRLYNFKRSAEILRCSPHKALLGMFIKHLVSIIDLIEKSYTANSELIDEKIGDGINYLILLEAIFRENLSIDVECFDCGECSNGDVK